MRIAAHRWSRYTWAAALIARASPSAEPNIIDDGAPGRRERARRGPNAEGLRRCINHGRHAVAAPIDRAQVCDFTDAEKTRFGDILNAEEQLEGLPIIDCKVFV